jgi:hypothetical protein
VGSTRSAQAAVFAATGNGQIGRILPYPAYRARTCARVTAGTSRSRHHARFVPAPASANRASPTSPQLGHRAQQQRSMRNQQSPSALSDLAKTIPRPTRLPRQIPIDSQALTAVPRVRSSVAFRRRPPYPGRRSRRAGIRNPSRFRSFAMAEKSASLPTCPVLPYTGRDLPLPKAPPRNDPGPETARICGMSVYGALQSEWERGQ